MCYVLIIYHKSLFCVFSVAKWQLCRGSNEIKIVAEYYMNTTKQYNQYVIYKESIITIYLIRTLLITMNWILKLKPQC